MIRRSLLRLAALLPVLLAAAPAVAQPVILRDIAGREATLPAPAKLAASSAMSRRMTTGSPFVECHFHPHG